MLFRAFCVAALTALALPACAPAPTPATEQPAADPNAPARLDVENRASTDFDVYLIRSGQRTRLGLAPGSRTTSFTLSRALLAGSGAVRFEARPTGNIGGEPVLSDPAAARPGEVITLEIPPQ